MTPARQSAGARHSGRLRFVLVLTATFMVVEATVGVLANSLVLVADAAHMLTDVAGLSFALLAIWFAQRPADEKRTYGYYRSEILAALLNALLLFAVSGYILYEAYHRFVEPPHVAGVPMVVVATLGMLVNLVSARLLLSGARENLNVRGAFTEVLSDLLGSAGAVAAGVILLTTGWRYADPLFAALVGLFILPRTLALLRNALDVLLESTPSHLRIADVQAAILRVPGVRSVHDLHVWTVTSGFVALSGHVLVPEGADRDGVLVELRRELAQRFEIEHVTIQIENERLAQALEQPCLPGDQPCEEAASAPSRGAASSPQVGATGSRSA